MKMIVVFILMFLGSGTAWAQVSPLDSMLQLLPAVKADTNAVLLYIDLGEQYRRVGDLESATDFHLKALSLSRELNYLQGIYYASDYYSFILKRQGLFDSAIIVNREIMDIALKQADAYQAAIEKWNIGTGYVYKGFHETALTYFLDALSWFEKTGYQPETGQLYNQLQIVYGRMVRYKEAIQYGEKGLANWSDTLSIAYGQVLRNLAICYYSLHPPQNEKALFLLQKTLEIATLNGDKMLEAEACNHIANIFFLTHCIDESEEYYRKALIVFKEESHPKDFCISNIGLAKIAMFRNDFTKAEAMALKNLDLASRFGIRTEERTALSFLWELSVARHDYVGRNRYKAATDSMQQIVVNETMLRAAEELQVKYETEKKELKITALEQDKLLYFWRSMAGAAVLLLLLAFFIVRHRLAVSRRKLADQKIKRLEQEKKLVATRAVLDGETAERSRLARDLHDGLGGLLSAVKLNLYEFKKGIMMENEKGVHFDHTMVMFEKSIAELRRVAHNLMPESLAYSGLTVSLSDFCKSIPDAEFHYYGSGDRLDSRLEAIIYRTALELVNNALKHANARKIIVQIVQESNRLALTVQDDGCGFDTSIPTTGTGLNNIRNRVNAFNGRLDIMSQPGNGTEIIVEFQLINNDYRTNSR